MLRKCKILVSLLILIVPSNISCLPVIEEEEPVDFGTKVRMALEQEESVIKSL